MENTELLYRQCNGIGPHLAARGKSRAFSRFAAGTRGIFSSYSRDGPSKLVFVQRCHDSCLVVRDTSGFSSTLCRSIGKPLEVRWETQGPFPVASGILGFLSLLKRSQASSPFEGLNFTCLWRCQRDVRPPVEVRWGSRPLSRFPEGICTSLHLVR